jgi:hypothetical protein
MAISVLSVRKAAAGAVGAGALAVAMLFGGAPVAQAAPPPAPGTSIAMAGPHGAPGVPFRGGHGWGHGGWGHGGWGHGGWGRGGDWDDGGWGWGPWWR